MKDGYKKQKLIDKGYLKVDDVNEIYFERYGTKGKQPVIYLHGGPGGGTTPICATFFNPRKYDIILFDQRGCGKSKPFMSTHNNNIFELVEDIEKLRKHFLFGKTIIFGGSFGSTLSLAYAIKYSENVNSLVLRGIFLGTNEEVNWLYKFGASEFFNEEFKEFQKILNDKEKENPIAAYYKIFNSANISEDLKDEAYIRFSNYEGNIVKLEPNTKRFKKGDKPSAHEKAIAYFENYYFYHHTFLGDDNYIEKNISKIKDIKTYIIHGRYDLVCRPSMAYKLSNWLNNCELTFVPLAGHSAFDKNLRKQLIKTMDQIYKNK